MTNVWLILPKSSEKSLIWSVHKYVTVPNNLKDHLYNGSFEYKYAIVSPATLPGNRQIFTFKYTGVTKARVI